MTLHHLALPGATNSVVQVAHIEDVLAFEPPIGRASNRAYWAALAEDMATESAVENNQWRGGVRGLQGLRDLVRDGWPQGRAVVGLMVDQLREKLPPPRSRRRQRSYGPDGEFDLDRWTAGRYDDPCSTHRRAVTLGSTVTLSVAATWGGSGSMTAQELFWAGACMVTLAVVFDHAGIGAELVLLDAGSYYDRPERFVSVLRLRDAGEALDVDSTTVLASHVGAFRTLGLALRCAMPFEIVKPEGLGHADSVLDWVPPLVRLNVLSPAPIIVPRLNTARAARSFLLRAIADFEAANVAALEEG